MVEVVVAALNPIQQKYKDIINDKSYLDSILKIGKEKATSIAEDTLESVKKLMGLV